MIRSVFKIPKKRIWQIRLMTLLMCLIAIFVMPLFTFAEGKDTDTTEETEERIVRVGWFDSKFNETDQFGRKTGYGYEYQRKIAAYTGWDYEYVEGSWPELFEMLEKGEIDLLADVSYSEERTDSLLYASLPMGTEAYYVFVDPDNQEIDAGDVDTLDGKKVGVDKGSIQIGFFDDWLDMHKIEVDLVEVSDSQDEALNMLQNGELDAYLTLDSFGDPDTVKPLWKVGSSDIYFAVNKDRPDILAELDSAMSRIQDENINYNNQLYEKYFSNTGTNHYLSEEELNWLENHSKIRVGYQDNYLAFCAQDPETGELTGALKDYLDYATTGLENAEIDFEPVCFPTVADAIDAMKKGEIDCVFPANLTDFDGEELDIVLTPPIMKTEMDAVVRASEQKEFIKSEDVRVAVNEGNTNYEMFLVEHYPSWNIVYFKDTPAGLDAVAAGDADCVIISNYRYNNISKQCEKLHLTTVYTGVEMEYSFAVNESDAVLYSILSKLSYDVPESVTNAALTYYSTEDVKTGFLEVIWDNIVPIMLIIIAIVLIILVLLVVSIRAEKRAIKANHLVKDLGKKAYVDELTKVRNKRAFEEYKKKIKGKVGKGKEVDFAIGILDCDNLKKINDEYGHDKGDIYLKGASSLICHVFRHSPVFRIGGDEFAVVVENEDYRNLEGLIKSFNRRKKELCELAENEWDEVNISIGIATFDPSLDKNLDDTIRRADKTMYKNKQVWKKHNKSKTVR